MAKDNLTPYGANNDGTPVVPADFAVAEETQAANQLTAEEVAEFRALRADKKANDERVAAEVAASAANLAAPTHHVHLADGSVVQGSTIATHYAHENGRTVPVSGVYEIEPTLS